jgi:hypothetical protein
LPADCIAKRPTSPAKSSRGAPVTVDDAGKAIAYAAARLGRDGRFAAGDLARVRRATDAFIEAEEIKDAAVIFGEQLPGSVTWLRCRVVARHTR